MGCLLTKELSLNSLSRYRTELMGFAAILILICHSTVYIKLPSVLSYVLSFGNIGNEVFLFLSGIGLFYSLTKQVGGAKSWYVRRYKRIIFPYLILAIPIGLYYCKGQSVLDYILYITTLSYWTNHNTAWFIAVLIPLYLVTPAVFAIQKKNGNVVNIVLMVVCYVIGLINVQKGDDLLSRIIYNVVYIMPNLPAFFLGLSIAKYVKEEKTISIWLLVFSFIMAFVALYLTKHLVYSYIFFLFPMLYLLIFIIELGLRVINKILNFMGDISLESYLCNTMLPIVLIPLCSALGIKGGLFYSLLIVVGTALSVLIHKLCKVR